MMTCGGSSIFRAQHAAPAVQCARLPFPLINTCHLYRYYHWLTSCAERCGPASGRRPSVTCWHTASPAAASGCCARAPSDSGHGAGTLRHTGVTVESRWSQGEGAVSAGGVAVDIFNNSHCTLPSPSLIPNNIHIPHHPYSPFPFQLTIPIPAHFPAIPLPTLLYNPHHSHSNSNSQFPFRSPLLIKFPTTRLTSTPQLKPRLDPSPTLVPTPSHDPEGVWPSVTPSASPSCCSVVAPVLPSGSPSCRRASARQAARWLSHSACSRSASSAIGGAQPAGRQPSRVGWRRPVQREADRENRPADGRRRGVKHRGTEVDGWISHRQADVLSSGSSRRTLYGNDSRLTRAPLGGGGAETAPPLYVSHSSKTERSRATKLSGTPSYINSTHVDQRKISHLW